MVRVPLQIEKNCICLNKPIGQRLGDRKGWVNPTCSDPTSRAENPCYKPFLLLSAVPP